jgi:hypothetical protein
MRHKARGVGEDDIVDVRVLDLEQPVLQLAPRDQRQAHEGADEQQPSNVHSFCFVVCACSAGR